MDPEQLTAHDPIALLSLIVVGLVGFWTCAVYLCSSWVRRGGPPRTAAGRWREVAALCGAGAIACYVWGLVHLLLVTGDSPFQACMEVLGRDRMATVDGYEGQYIPLRLMCSVEGGGNHAAGVPGYLNPAVALLTFLALFSAVLALAGRRADNRTPRSR